jgi:uncharacterized protein
VTRANHGDVMDTQQGLRLASFCLLVFPFLVNDFANIYVRDARLWLAIDYAFVKGLPLAVLWFLVRKGIFTWKELGLTAMPWKPFLVWSAILGAAGVALERMASRLAWLIVPYPALGRFPSIEDPRLYALDLTVGMFGVGFVEEIIFRGTAYASLRNLFRSSCPPVLVSSVLFALIHWSLGPAALVSTGIMGVFFMLAYLRVKNLWPLIVSHALIDFLLFSRFPLPSWPF